MLFHLRILTMLLFSVSFSFVLRQQNDAVLIMVFVYSLAICIHLHERITRGIAIQQQNILPNQIETESVSIFLNHDVRIVLVVSLKMTNENFNTFAYTMEFTLKMDCDGKTKKGAERKLGKETTTQLTDSLHKVDSCRKIVPTERISTVKIAKQCK